MNVQRMVRSIIQRFRASARIPLILMYHRIANELTDPWGLAVTPAHFEEHLDALRRTRFPLRLSQFVRQLVAGTLPEHAVAVTFDDGYADNLLVAKPQLAAADVPATVFLATGYLDRPGEFWWDELARLLLLEDGPGDLELVVRGLRMQFDLGTEHPDRSSTWRAWTAPRTARHVAYMRIWETLRRLNEDERNGLMSNLRSAFSNDHALSGAGRAMINDEAKALISDGLIEIGAHTVTHPLLTELEPADRSRELEDSKAACERLIGRPVPAFAYPYGDLDPHVRSAVVSAGFGYAVSTVDQPVSANFDLFSLPRLQVLDCDGEVFERTVLVTSAGAHLNVVRQA
jgi:peptidoglycan/xylan/chitin deacetylase (PgdA/CDA1 family)